MTKVTPLTMSRVSVTNFGCCVTKPSGFFCVWLLLMNHSLKCRVILTSTCTRMATAAMSRMRVNVEDS